MDIDPEPSNSLILLSANPEKIQMAPGSQQTIQVNLVNGQTGEDLFDLTVQGIPIEWIALDQRMVHLGAGEQRTVELILTVPDSPDLRASRFPFTIQAVSQAHPGVHVATTGELTVAAYQSEGRIGVLLGRLMHGVIPGAPVVIPILLQNRGLAADTFHLEVKDIPAAWVSTTNAFTHLEPGEQKEIAFSIQPPRSFDSGVGLVQFTIAIYSQLAPGQPELIRSMLKLEAFSAFTSRMEPNEITTATPAHVTVRNDGNISDVFLIEFLSQEAGLIFERADRSRGTFDPANPVQPEAVFSEITQPQFLRIQPGRTESLEFRSRPRKAPLFGREYSLPFTTRVVSSKSRREVAHTGTFFGRALIPIWVPVAASILLLALLCVVLVSALANQNLASRQDQTAQAGTQLALALTQNASVTPLVATYTIAIPVTGPTLTPVTPLPTPTFTAIVPSPTATQAPPIATPTTAPPTPTNTAVPPTVAPTATLAPTGVPATATLQPGPALTGTIAFQSNRDGNPELYALNNSTQRITRLTANQAVDSQPALAPDGVRVAYVSNQTGNNDIFVTGTDLRTPVNLTNNAADDQQPAWSPDGQWIAFTTNRDGNSEVYIMRADGTQLRNLTNNPANDFSPTWFVTGGLLDRQEWIAFTTNRDGNQEIYTIKPDGTGALNLTKNPANDYSPSGSNNLIAFVSERDGNQEIYTMSLDGAVQTNVTNNPGRDYDPVISPDGAWIAFTSERDGNPEIYVIRTDGTSAANLTRNPAQDSHPSWR